MGSLYRKSRTANLKRWQGYDRSTFYHTLSKFFFLYHAKISFNVPSLNKCLTMKKQKESSFKKHLPRCPYKSLYPSVILIMKGQFWDPDHFRSGSQEVQCRELKEICLQHAQKLGLKVCMLSNIKRKLQNPGWWKPAGVRYIRASQSLQLFPPSSF